MPRRGNGEGTIGRRRDGRWETRYCRDGRRVSIYGRTRAEVQQHLREALRARDARLPVPSGRLRLGDFLRQWVEGVRPGLAPSTYRSYEQLLRIHVVPSLGALRLADLGPEHLQRLYASCLASGLSAQTVKLVHAVVHKALADGVKWDLVARNVATLAGAPRVPRHEARALTASDLLTLIDETDGDWLGSIVPVAACTGLREGELLALRWSDVDLDRATLHVRRTLAKAIKGHAPSDTKTPQARRTVAMASMAVDALRAHRVSQLEWRLRLGAEWRDEDLVFPSARGTQMNPSNLGRWFRRAVRNAGLPHLRFHELRHTCATLLLSAGTNPKVVQEMLGHSSIKVTLDIYSHVLPTIQEEAVRRLDLLLTEAHSGGAGVSAGVKGSQ